MKKALFAIGAVCLVAMGYLMYGKFVDAQTAGVPAPTSALTKIPILTYHSVRPYYPGITNLVKEYTVPPDIFDEQLKYMKDNGFTAVTPDDVVNYFTKGAPLPPKPFMVTLDDGWENQFRYAFPILQKYRISGVFYIYGDTIGKRVFLSWNQIRTMVKANMIIGGHTESHPELPKITSSTVLQGEIIDSKKFIEAHIGTTVDTFAYPFGEYDDPSVRLVTSGYASARALKGCVYQSRDILFTLCGVIITGDFNRFVAVVNRK